MFRLPVALLLLAALLASPVASAKKPHKKAKTVIYKVEYDGHGAWSRHGKFEQQCLSGKSDESATFDWDYTWPRVKLNLKSGDSEILVQPKGKLTVTADHTSSDKVTPPCEGPDPAPCSASDVKYHGGAKGWAHLGMAIQTPSHRLLILPRADASLFGGDEDQCTIYAADATDHPVIFQEAIHEGSDEPPVPTPLTALKATIPVKDLLESGKHIINVSNQPGQLPGDEYDCGNGQTGLTCNESQGWTGHITLTRLKK